MDALIIPDFQPVPFPAPLWLLKLLLVLGMFLHVIPMNIALGGGFVSGFCLLQSSDFAKRFGHSLALVLPVVISFAITQGIVPLLFLQLVYGPLYYTSSVLMAVPWLSILGLLLVGYYATYLYKFRHAQLGPKAAWVLIGASTLFTLIGIIFTSNMTLMLTPEKWESIMVSHQYGLFLNLDDPQGLPRFLHFFLAAFAVTGLFMGCYGVYWHSRENPYGEWLIKTGSGLFLGVTLLQLGVGSWFLLTIPRELMRNYMGQELIGSVAFMGSMTLLVLSLVCVGLAWKNGKPGIFKLGASLATLVLLLMVVMRHMLREYTVNPFFSTDQIAVNTQWDLLIVFIVSAVGLIAYLVWLIKLTWKAFNAPQSTAT